MFEIVFLGTSASAPSAKRGLSAQIVKHDEFRFLIDCGERCHRPFLPEKAEALGVPFGPIRRDLALKAALGSMCFGDFELMSKNPSSQH